MKTGRAGSILVWSCSAILALSGCHRQKPVVLLPQEPPATTSPQQTQETQQNPAQQPPAATQQPEQQQQTADNKPAPPKPKPAPKHPKQHTASNKKPENKPEKSAQDKPATQEVAKNNPSGRIVIKEGTTTAPANTIQIAPAMTHDAAGHSQATTGQLLDSTDANLRQIINRQLSPNEQSMLEQCKDYETQSREAVKNGDMERAHNLALKAHLLSDELVKPH